MGFYLTSDCSSIPDGALKSSHSFSTPSVYSKRIASGSKDLVQSILLSDTKDRGSDFPKSWNLGSKLLSKLFILCYQKLWFEVQIPVPRSQLFWFGATLEEVQKSAFLTHAPGILMRVARGPGFKL